jgi:hypothetical protein
LQHRSAPPPGHTPPVLGTRERSCPHRPCSEPENDRPVPPVHQKAGRPSVTDRARHPPRLAQSVEIRESGSAWPGPVGLLSRTQAPWQTDKRINI